MFLHILASNEAIKARSIAKKCRGSTCNDCYYHPADGVFDYCFSSQCCSSQFLCRSGLVIKKSSKDKVVVSITSSDDPLVEAKLCTLRLVTVLKFLSTYLYMVSASTSENHTLRSGVKFSPVISSMVRSTPPDSFSPSITGMGVTGADTGPMPS